MAKDGDLIPVRSTKNHESVANDLGSTSSRMFEQGYIRLVTGYGNISVEARRAPSSAQVSVIKNLATGFPVYVKFGEDTYRARSVFEIMKILREDLDSIPV